MGILYEAHERQHTNAERDVIGTKVVFRPEKFRMQEDLSKKRMTELLMRGCKD